MKPNWAPAVLAWGVIFSVGVLFSQRNRIEADTESPQLTGKGKTVPCNFNLAPEPTPHHLAFGFKEGDRVVLLGGTMIEREQRHAGWEMLMTVLHPKQRISFRNLGWSGDTVWADSRGIFDSPAKGYQQMIAQVKEFKPTVILLGYGSNEAFQGPAGLEAFLSQYKKLLNDLKPTKARLVFFGPPAHNRLAFPLADETEKLREANLKLYANTIQKLANEQDAPFVDLFQAITQWMKTAERFSEGTIDPISENGVHWNARGYWFTALYLQRTMGWPQPRWNLTCSLDGKVEPAPGVRVENFQIQQNGLEFNAVSKCLPLSKDYGHTLIVTGLKPGQYALEIDGKNVAKGDQQNWADGVLIQSGPEFVQAEKLREAIQNKNRLYFHRWRPQNVTYLFLFRKHEQGQNAKEVPQYDPLIAKQEELIQSLKHPKPHKYTLRRVP